MTWITADARHRTPPSALVARNFSCASRVAAQATHFAVVTFTKPNIQSVDRVRTVHAEHEIPAVLLEAHSHECSRSGRCQAASLAPAGSDQGQTAV